MIEVRALIDAHVRADVSILVKTLAEEHELLSHKVLHFSSKGVKEIDRSIGLICAQAKYLLEPVSDYEEAAREAGYDGSLGGEEEWCRENDIGPYDRVVSEHWIVSDWLAEKLVEKGEKVDRNLAGLKVWARISIDPVRQSHSASRIHTMPLAADPVLNVIAAEHPARSIAKYAPQMLALLNKAVRDWPQFNSATDALPTAGCQEEQDEYVNGGDLVEWFGEWVRSVRVVLAKTEGNLHV